MNKKAFSIVLTLLLLTTIVFAKANNDVKPYSPELGKATMQTILGAMMEIKPALGSNDFDKLEKNFKVLEDSFVTMHSMLPPKGDPEDWSRINKRMVELSQMAQEAARNKDGMKIGGILGEMQELNKEGHGKYQKY